MLPQIQTTLAEICSPYTDKRTQLCELEVLETDNGRITLKGTVLNAATLTAVSQGLQSQFPGHVIDSGSVNILRESPGQFLTVITSITGLYDDPGFNSKMGSELTNGTAVERLQEEKNWCFVRQTDGYLGWVYRPYLADVPLAEQTTLVCEPVAFLRAAPEHNAELLNRVLAGTAVAILQEQNNWQQIQLAGGQTGWLPAANLRSSASMPQTKIAQQEQLMADATRFTGVPYLWAGTSAYGIDCSGYVQLLHRLCGLTLLRDADMQFAVGQPVETPFQPGHLLFFGSDQGHRRISHVGMSMGGWQMIHASRNRNGVFIDDVQVVDHLRETFMGARSFLRVQS